MFSAEGPAGNDPFCGKRGFILFCLTELAFKFILLYHLWYVNQVMAGKTTVTEAAPHSFCN
jgi:hypothetical protein